MLINEFGFVYLLNYSFESSFHPSIIDAPKGMATGFSVFILENLNEESLFLAWALNHP